MSQQNKNKTQFDFYADDYLSHVQDALPAFAPDVKRYASVKAMRIADYAKTIKTEGEELILLDVGCGVGLTDGFIKSSFLNMFGVDVSYRSIELASQINPEVNYTVYDGTNFPYQESSFHLIFCVCVLHHIDPENWQGFIDSMRQLLKPGGSLMIIEHNPTNPITRWIVSRCDLDKNASLLSVNTSRSLLKEAGLTNISKEFFLFLPLESQFWYWFESKILKCIPLGAQYIVCGVKPPE